MLDVKLRYLPCWIEDRREISNQYRAGLEGVGDLRLPHFGEADQRDVFQNYVIRTTQRDELRDHLKASGVETLVHWPKPMWRHPGLGLGDPELPETASICREVISLPMSAETTQEHVERTVLAIRQFFR